MVPEGWQYGRIDSFFVLQRGYDLTAKSRVDGPVPVYSSSGVSYFHNEVKVKGPGIVTGRKGSVGSVFLIEEDFWPHDTTLWIKDFKGNDLRYIKYFLDAMRLERFDEASSVPTLNRNNVHRVKTAFPPLIEQRKIAKTLNTWDKAIATTEKLIEASKQQKKALMQQLLTGKKRFSGFDGEWEKVAFGDVVHLSSKKYNPLKNTECLPCIELEHIDQDSGRIINTAKASKLASMKNHFSAGNVIFGKLRPYLRKFARPMFDGVCSTEIWVFDSSDKVLDEYLLHLVQTDKFISEANKSAGSKMPRADWSVVSELVIKLPSLEEQQKIASVFTSADAEIENFESKLAHIRQEKKALMQQLLTGKRRVKVEAA